jgi:hypothetical protein
MSHRRAVYVLYRLLHRWHFFVSCHVTGGGAYREIFALRRQVSLFFWRIQLHFRYWWQWHLAAKCIIFSIRPTLFDVTRPESWFLLGHKLIPMIPFDIILFLNKFLWTIWWQLDTKYLMPTQSLIIDIKLKTKTNTDTNQNWVSCWVQFLVCYLISYCWLQVDDKCLNTNWNICVGSS